MVMKNSECYPEKIRFRHEAIMEALIMHPDKSHRDLAKLVGYSENRFCIIVNSPLFKEAFKEFRNGFRSQLSHMIVEATKDAIKVNQDLMKNEQLVPEVRQVSSKIILDQGHAKAVEKSASLHANIELPPGILQGLASIIEESKPLETVKRLEKAVESRVGDN